MNEPLRLQIAQRIHAGLVRELGQPINVRQLLSNSLYARDVLLVCDAFTETDLCLLSGAFRRASESAEPGGGSDFGVSLPAPMRAAAPVRARRWHSPSSWFEG